MNTPTCIHTHKHAHCVQGKYQDQPPLPFIPGNEVSGRVLEVGPGVKGIQPGDAVVAAGRGGAFAEQCVVHQGAVWNLPGE